MTLTKAHVIEGVYKRTNLKRSQATRTVETALEIIKRTLESGEDVMISRFGKFQIKEKNRRKGRNPQTGNYLILAPRRTVTFRCSPVLKEKMNGKM